MFFFNSIFITFFIKSLNLWGLNIFPSFPACFLMTGHFFYQPFPRLSLCYLLITPSYFDTTPPKPQPFSNCFTEFKAFWVRTGSESSVLDWKAAAWTQLLLLPLSFRMGSCMDKFGKCYGCGGIWKLCQKISVSGTSGRSSEMQTRRD